MNWYCRMCASLRGVGSGEFHASSCAVLRAAYSNLFCGSTAAQNLQQLQPNSRGIENLLELCFFVLKVGDALTSIYEQIIIITYF